MALRKKCPYSELFWSVFSRIRTEYREIQSISPYSVRMQENTDKNNFEYGYFLRNGLFSYLKFLPLYQRIYSKGSRISQKASNLCHIWLANSRHWNHSIVGTSGKAQIFHSFCTIFVVLFFRFPEKVHIGPVKIKGYRINFECEYFWGYHFIHENFRISLIRLGP